MELAMQSIIKNELNEHLNVCSKTIENIAESIEIASKICITSLLNGGKILIFGNGGSASDAQHIAAELVGRYKVERRGLAAIALTTDSSIITSVSNDFGYLNVFERQVEALAKSGDVLVGISTKGTSKNVINALTLGKNLKCSTIGLSGGDGGQFSSVCDVNLIASSFDTPRIQEMHILIGHTICHLIDLELTK